MDIGGLIGAIIAAPFLFIGWIISGFIAGALARRVMAARNMPFWNDIILGILGGIVGGFVVGLLGFYTPETGLSAFIVNILVAVVGAVILIWIGRKIRGQ